MKCLLCRRSLGGLSPHVSKLLQNKEQEISRIFGNSKVDLYIMNNDELLYCTEPSSILVKDVTNSDVRDMILRLKHSAGKLASHLQKGNFILKSLHIKGSKSIFSLYTTSDQFDVAFYSQFGSAISIMEMDTTEADNRMLPICSELLQLLS